MAAAEYYMGTAAAQQVGSQRPPNPYPPQQPQYAQQLQSQKPHEIYSNTPPPSYSVHPPPSQNQPQGYPSQPSLQQQHPNYPAQPPYSSAGRLTYPATQSERPQEFPPQQNGYLGAPLQPIRSHSQPPRVQFTNDSDSDSTSRSLTSDSDSPQRRRHRHHHKHRHSHSSTRDYDAADDHRSSRSHHHHHHRESRSQQKEHRDRDTFLGAGAGGLLGDAIFPGLGTAAGLLLGGYGARKHASSRSRSEAGGERERSDRVDHGGWHSGHRREESGWDANSATFKKGSAVR